MSFTILLPISSSHHSDIQRQQNIQIIQLSTNLENFCVTPSLFFSFPRPTRGSKDVLCNAALALQLSPPISQKPQNMGL